MLEGMAVEISRFNELDDDMAVIMEGLDILMAQGLVESFTEDSSTKLLYRLTKKGRLKASKMTD